MAEKVRAALKVNFYFLKFFLCWRFLYSSYIQKMCPVGKLNYISFFFRENEIIHIWKVTLKDGCGKILHLGFLGGCRDIFIIDKIDFYFLFIGIQKGRWSNQMWHFGAFRSARRWTSSKGHCYCHIKSKYLKINVWKSNMLENKFYITD